MKAGFFLGIVFVIIVMIVGGVAYAGNDSGPKQCPAGQRGECHYYQQNTTGKYGCFPASANLGNGWVKVSNDCPQEKEDNKPTATSKSVVVVEPTTVPEPTDTPIEIYTGKKDKDGKEIVLVESMNQVLSCPVDCTCQLLEDAVWYLAELGEQLSRNNELQLTAIAVDKERNEILRGE